LQDRIRLKTSILKNITVNSVIASLVWEFPFVSFFYYVYIHIFLNFLQVTEEKVRLKGIKNYLYFYTYFYTYIPTNLCICSPSPLILRLHAFLPFIRLNKTEYVCKFSDNTSLFPKFVLTVNYTLIRDLSQERDHLGDPGVDGTIILR
jgi:hypothetical protein